MNIPVSNCAVSPAGGSVGRRGSWKDRAGLALAIVLELTLMAILALMVVYQASHTSWAGRPGRAMGGAAAHRAPRHGL